MNVIIGVLITFLVIILVLYLVNMLPIDGRASRSCASSSSSLALFHC